MLLGMALLLFALFVPGYCISLPAFQGKGIAAEERILFSVIFSMVLVPALLAIENRLFGVPISFQTVLSNVLALIAIGLALHYAKIRAGTA